VSNAKDGRDELVFGGIAKERAWRGGRGIEHKDNPIKKYRNRVRAPRSLGPHLDRTWFRLGSFVQAQATGMYPFSSR
jgi:hypothetical protein